jgi:hypothetical protein
MATTTGGTTYVTSTDLVADYPTASLALANRVDVVASGGPVLVKTSGYTITVADILAGNKFLYNSASGGTFTLPTSSLVDGMIVEVAQIGAGALTVSGGTIVGTTVTTAQYQGLRFVYVASGTTWYSVAPAATAPGLAIVTPTSTANSGGSLTVVGGFITFTAVNSVSLNGVFSSTYDNYRIMIRSTAASSNGQLNMRLRAAGTDASGGDYAKQDVSGFGGTAGAGASTGQTSWNIGYIATSYGNRYMGTLDVLGPNMALNTLATANVGQQDNTATAFTIQANLNHGLTTQYDGLSLIAAAGTISGYIRVYGYKNS